MRRKMFGQDQRAATSVLGEIFTVGIVVSLVAVGGAAALDKIGTPGATTDTQLRAVLDCGSGAWYDGDELIVIYHRGGPVLKGSGVMLQLNINGRESTAPLDARLATKAMLDGGGVHGNPNLDSIGAQYAASDAADAAAAEADAAEAVNASAQAALAAVSGPQAIGVQAHNIARDVGLNTKAAVDAAYAGKENLTRLALGRAIDLTDGLKVLAGDPVVADDPFVQSALVALVAAIDATDVALSVDEGTASSVQLVEMAIRAEALKFAALDMAIYISQALPRGAELVALKQAASLASAEATAARSAATAARIIAEAAGAIVPQPFEVGSAWVSQPQKLREDAYIAYTIRNQVDNGASAIVADGLLTERVCGGQSTILGVYQENFGLLPYIDYDCDGAQTEGDELLERTDFDDGYFVVPGTSGCLIIPEGIEPIEAESIHLAAPGGITVEVDLRSTNGPIELRGGDGQVDASGIRIDSSEGVDIHGQSVDISHSNITAPGGHFRVQADDGAITAKGLKVVAGLPGSSAPPEPIVDLPNHSGPGSIRVCVALLDSTNRVTNGWQWHERTFTVGGRGGVPGYPAEGILPDVVVQAPIPLNADIFYGDGIKDAYCVLYNDLEIGGWFYKQGVVDDPANWEVSLHNDQNKAIITTVDDFFHYSPQLFDGDPSNDDERNQNADGHISLTSSRPYRTMVTLFRSTDALAAEIAIDSDGGDIDLSDAEFLAHGADVAVDSDGGAITANRFIGTAAGDLGQVRIDSDGGAITARQARLTATNGHVLVFAGTGTLDLSDAIAKGRYGVDLSGGPDINLRNAVLNSTDDQVDVLVTGLLVRVDQTGAHVTDRDAIGAVIQAPGSVGLIIGAPAQGGFAIL